jgi:glycosyltransferase involved in cell wall biosynthesis
MDEAKREQNDHADSRPDGRSLGRLVLLGSINSYPRSRIDHFCTCQWSLILLGQLRGRGVLDSAEVWFASDEAYEFEKYGVHVRCFTGFDEMAEASCPTDVLWVRGISKPFVQTLNRMPARLRVYYAASKRLLPYRWNHFDLLLVDDRRQIGPVARLGVASHVDRIIKTTDPTIFRPLPGVAKLYDLCMIGEMRAPRKNFSALARLLTAAPHLSALVIGEHTPQVIWQLRETGARVEFVRFCPREQLNLVMNQARIGFVPNLLDAAPRVIQEFMAAGVPVLLNAAILGGRDYITPETGVLAAESEFVGAVHGILAGELPLDPRAGFMLNFRPEKAADHLASVLARAMLSVGRQSPALPPSLMRQFFTGPWRPRAALAGCLREIAADSNLNSPTARHLSPAAGEWGRRERGTSAARTADRENEAMTDDRPICISIAIPAYNEADNLGPLHAAISMAADPLGVPWELILVDDGSTDGTWEMIGKLHALDPRVRGVKLRSNCGQTAASEAGMRRARGKYIVTMDADLQNDPSDLPMLFTTIEHGGWDMVTGTRVKSRSRGDNIIRRISSRIANRVRNWISDDQISDSGCCFRIFRRDCLDRIKFYKGMHRFLPTLFRMEGFRVAEVDVKTNPRHAGVSKYGIWNRVFKATIDLLAVRWMKSRHIGYEIDAEHGASDADRSCLKVFDGSTTRRLERTADAA